jgi:hypothetical protein
MSAFGTKQTSEGAQLMYVFGVKRTSVRLNEISANDPKRTFVRMTSRIISQRFMSHSATGLHVLPLVDLSVVFCWGG